LSNELVAVLVIGLRLLRCFQQQATAPEETAVLSQRPPGKPEVSRKQQRVELDQALGFLMGVSATAIA
jgi:hypothetical protein